MSKVAVVTGGTRGIGLHISKALIDQGYDVVAIYQGNDEAAKKSEEDVGVKAVKLDVTDFDACMETCAKIEEEIGPIHVLVNNAGIIRDGTLHKMSPENWNAVIQTNIGSCFNMCRSVINAMRERKDGRIINISSINGQKGQFGQTNYSAAKAAMLGFTKALALESAAKGITVNVICPGYIETEMAASIRPEVLDSIIKEIPAGRMGHPHEIAGLVAYLASDLASFITGSTFSANGGQYMV